MAGDWIKIEHVMPEKPEIDQLADTLGIDPDTVVGKLVRLWIWADQQSINGNALGVTQAFIDRKTNCPGFSEGLIQVGWLKVRNGRLSLPNFDRLNGQTAKARALTSRRVKRSRNADTVTKPLPEKNRGEKIKRGRRGDEPEFAGMHDDAQAIIDLWNATPGTRRCAGVQTLDLHQIYDCLTHPHWMENLREALKRFPLRRLGEDLPAINFVLDPTRVGNILNGSFDGPPSSGGSRPAKKQITRYDLDENP